MGNHFFFVKAYYPDNLPTSAISDISDNKSKKNESQEDDFILFLGILNYGRVDGHSATSFTKNCFGHPDKVLCMCGKVHPAMDCMDVDWNKNIDG